MKQFLLSFVFIVSISAVFGQVRPDPTVPNPNFFCPREIKSNQGGGNCKKEVCENPNQPDFFTPGNDITPTAKVTLIFDRAPACAPRLFAIIDKEDRVRLIRCGTPSEIEQVGQTFQIEYCLYGTENNDNFFNQPDLRAVLRYYCDASGTYVEIACTSKGEQVPVPTPDQGPLPVTFKSFNAKRSANNKVDLTWETATEINNKGFKVQRNTGNGWTDVTLVASKANGGNSTNVLAYSYTDNNAEKGLTQYRLMQVDLDGRMKQSEIRSVRGEAQQNKVMIYPNPTNDGSVTVLFEDGKGNRDVIISDMNGRLVKQYRNIAATTLRMDNLNPGMYSIRIINQVDGSTVNEKLVVNK